MTPELRIGDADREAAVQSLGEHFAVGRLTREEYDERTGVVWSARTRGELAPVFADLPGAEPSRRPDLGFAVRRHGPLVPALVPLLIALVVISAITHRPFFLIGLAILMALRFGRIRRRHASGRRFASRGSWA